MRVNLNTVSSQPAQPNELRELRLRLHRAARPDGAAGDASAPAGPWPGLPAALAARERLHQASTKLKEDRAKAKQRAEDAAVAAAAAVATAPQLPPAPEVKLRSDGEELIVEEYGGFLGAADTGVGAAWSQEGAPPEAAPQPRQVPPPAPPPGPPPPWTLGGWKAAPLMWPSSQPREELWGYQRFGRQDPYAEDVLHNRVPPRLAAGWPPPRAPRGRDAERGRPLPPLPPPPPRREVEEGEIL